MRKITISLNEYYHVYNRGNNKQNIFYDKRDWTRFLFLILHFQSPLIFQNLTRPVNNYVRSSAFNIPEEKLRKIIKDRYVELINFSLMPNHFHLTVKEKQENGLSNYMHRIQTSYTKYFNIKYNKSGHLLQGPYKIVHIEDNEQLLHLSTYIHRNPREIKEWKNKEHKYNWSSFQDYINNRWDNLLNPDIILDQFTNKEEYQNFCESSGTKLEIDEEYLMD